ncbi:hypothetical protein CYQ90_24135 [Vibrio parahaemolyticus]|nr:hypothetical protein CYQ90_24135 [Vibrio parahaemolyticus]
MLDCRHRKPTAKESKKESYRRSFAQSHNAQLRGEQRLYPNLKHCAINTKIEVEAKMPSVVNPS